MGAHLCSNPEPPVLADSIHFLAGLVTPSGCTSLLAGQGPLQVGGEGKGRVCTMMGILFPTQVAVIKPQKAGGWKLTVFTK